MPKVTVMLPSLLARFAEGEREVAVEAETVGGALERLFELHESLRLHVVDERGTFRQHVLCFHNDTNTRWGEDDALQHAVADGDTVTLMQAVSGG